MRFPRRRRALWLRPALAHVLLQSFQPAVLTRWLTTAPRFGFCAWCRPLPRAVRIQPQPCRGYNCARRLFFDHQNRRSQGVISSTCCPSRTYYQLRNTSPPPDGRSFPSFELQTSDPATSLESPTPRSYAFRWIFCSTTAESATLPEVRLRYSRSQPLRIHPSQLQPRPRPRLPCSSVRLRTGTLRSCASGHAYHCTLECLRPFLMIYDAYIDSFGVALEQEQPVSSVRPIDYISRATLGSERHWTSLEVEADSIVWAIKRLRAYLWGTKFRIFSDHKALESIGRIRDHNARVQR